MRRILTYVLILALFTFSELIYAANKIIYLVSPPRSLSTVFVRYMEARGDFEVFNEPCQKLHVDKYFKEFSNAFLENAPKSWDEVKSNLYRKSERKDIFVKEMSFVAKYYAMQDQSFLDNSRVTVVFLVRDPHSSLISWYNVANKGSLDIAKTTLGYDALYESIIEAKKFAKNKVIIIISEHLEHPKATLAKFCEEIDISVLENALQWNQENESFDETQRWNGVKVKEVTHKWHNRAIYSKEFGKVTRYDIDGQGQPTFSEIKMDKDRMLAKEIYLFHKKYYDLIIKMNDITLI